MPLFGAESSLLGLDQALDEPAAASGATTSAGGSIASIAVAITRFHSVAASPPAIIRLMPITVVYIDSSVVTSSGHRYWFQPKMNRMTNSAAMLVRDSGTHDVPEEAQRPGAVDARRLGQLVWDREEELAEEERRRRRSDQRNGEAGVGVQHVRGPTTTL